MRQGEGMIEGRSNCQARALLRVVWQPGDVSR